MSNTGLFSWCTQWSCETLFVSVYVSSLSQKVFFEKRRSSLSVMMQYTGCHRLFFFFFFSSSANISSGIPLTEQPFVVYLLIRFKDVLSACVARWQSSLCACLEMWWRHGDSWADAVPPPLFGESTKRPRLFQLRGFSSLPFHHISIQWIQLQRWANSVFEFPRQTVLFNASLSGTFFCVGNTWGEHFCV